MLLNNGFAGNYPSCKQAISNARQWAGIEKRHYVIYEGESFWVLPMGEAAPKGFDPILLISPYSVDRGVAEIVRYPNG